MWEQSWRVMPTAPISLLAAHYGSRLGAICFIPSGNEHEPAGSRDGMGILAEHSGLRKAHAILVRRKASYCPAKSPLLSASSMKATKARAFALMRRPVGNTAHRSIGGSIQSCNTALTAPLFSSGNIHSDATARPRPEKTAARTPSAAVTRTRPVTFTDVWVLPLLNVHAVPPPRRS